MEHAHSLRTIFWWRGHRSNRTHHSRKVLVLPGLHMLIDALPAGEELQRIHLTLGRVNLLDRPPGARSFRPPIVTELHDFEHVVLELGLHRCVTRDGDAEGGYLGDGRLAGGNGVGCEVYVVWVWVSWSLERYTLR
jgi:hypothetical protein